EYDSVNQAVLELVPTGRRHVLDLGCGGGALGRALREQGAARVSGVTFNEREAERARAKLDPVVVADLNTLSLEALDGPFDCVVCSHMFSSTSTTPTNC